MNRLAVAAVPLLLVLATGCARENETDTVTAPEMPTIDMPSAPAMAAVTLPEFVTKVAMTDMFEIEAAKIAQQKARGAAVKTFARQMVADHTATTTQLKSLLSAETAPPPVPTALDQDHLDRLAKLRAASASDFDTLYLDQQTEAHENALNLLRSYAQNGDNARIRAFAAETAPKVERHLEMARTMDRTGADDTAKSKS